MAWPFFDALGLAMSYVRYTPDVEVKQPHEDEQIEEIVALMHAAGMRAFDRHRHGIREAHAKQHGTVVGTLKIPSLPAHLAQGLFAKPAEYPVVIRFSSAPNDIKDDAIPSPYGMAIKVIGVPGKKILPAEQDALTQDFLLVSMPVIPFGTVAQYLRMQKIIAHQDAIPDELQKAAGTLARGGQKALNLLGVHHPLIEGLAAPSTHILGQTFHSMAAIRFGDHVAKISAAPWSDGVRALAHQPVDVAAHPSAQRNALVDFFCQQGAEYQLRAQLCVDVQQMPVEDASVLWDEALSPHQPIARLVIPRQNAYSPARRVYADDVLSFNPWHALPEHQPLGSIMRVRIKAYESSSAFRHAMNARPRVEPRDIGEVPD